MSLLGMLGDGTDELQQLATYDDVEDKLVVRTKQDVTAILKNNKSLYSMGDGYSPTREWRRAASIPNVVIHKWYKQGIRIEDPNAWPLIASALDSPEFLHFRTAPGRLSDSPRREYFTSTGSRGSKPDMGL